jgi:hypothetical protein
MPKRRLVGLVACLIIMGISVPGAGAQDATPEAELVTPDPAECRVEPRSVENMTDFLATPAAAAASLASAAATPDADPVPEGEPAVAAQRVPGQPSPPLREEGGDSLDLVQP